MKVMIDTLTCLLLLTGLRVAQAVKIHGSRVAEILANGTNSSNSTTSSVCAGNRFPMNETGIYNFSGSRKFENVFNDSALQPVLQSDPDWLIGRYWKLQMTVLSNESSDREFAFSGSLNGFLNINIPAYAQGNNVSSIASVESTENHTHFEYRGTGFVENVVVTNICLRPALCSEAFNDSCPEAHVLKPAGTYGGTQRECCRPLMCNNWTCSPNTTYTLKSNADCIVGASDSACCTSIVCDPGLCNSSAWEPKPGTGWIGSTPEECCNPRMCAKYSCSDPTTWGKLPESVTETTCSNSSNSSNDSNSSNSSCSNESTPRVGSTDEECCYQMWCGAFDCYANTKFKNKSDHNATRGRSFALCCDVQSCGDYNCSVASQWLHKAANDSHGRRYNGSTDNECCKPKLCREYTCANSSAYRIASNLSEGARGSTDAECCTRRECEDYTCSDPSKYTKMASHVAEDAGGNNIARLGYSDAECCEPIYCNSVKKICQPCTKWATKPNFSTILGSTDDECCDKVMCSNYTCKQPTKYRLKGNYATLQGNSDKECCDPMYCSDFTVTLNTQFKKNYEKGRLGSTDEECSEILYCANYTCSQGGNVIDGSLWGSTDCECCSGNRTGCPS